MSLDRLFPGWADTVDAPAVNLMAGDGGDDGPGNHQRNCLAFPEFYGSPTHEPPTFEEWQE